jgi:hypothetical protein
MIYLDIHPENKKSRDGGLKIGDF